MAADNYDPSTYLYWFRKIDRHPDADVDRRGAEFRDSVATELGLRLPCPRINWFRPEKADAASDEWLRDVRSKPDAKWGIDDDPLSAPSAVFRLPQQEESRELFWGFTPADYRGVIGIAVDPEQGSIFEAIAHECKHVAQDEEEPGWRMSNVDEAELDAKAFVERLRARWPEWLR